MAEQKVVGLTPNPTAPEDWVEMTHKDVEKPMRCSPRAVEHWKAKARGWSVVSQAKASRASTGSES